MYILDTNTLIYFFKGMGNVSRNLLSVPPKEIGLPAIVLYELEVGIEKSKSPRKRKSQLKNFIEVVNVIPFGYEEAKHTAKVRAALEKNGTPIGPYDILIAGTALSAKSILVTHNKREFEKIEGLQLVDWY